MSEETRWPLTDSQLLALEAVEEKLAFWEKERQRRGQIVFVELATTNQVDPAKHQGRLELRDGRLVFIVTPIEATTP